MLSEKLAGLLLVIVILGFALFHILVVLEYLPANLVWGNQVKCKKQLFKLEVVSIVGLVVCALIVGLRMNYLHPVVRFNIPAEVMSIMALLFGLNAVVNIISKNAIEKFGFAFTTLLITMLALQLI
jgi:hypothetical protein